MELFGVNSVYLLENLITITYVYVRQNNKLRNDGLLFYI